MAGEPAVSAWVGRIRDRPHKAVQIVIEDATISRRHALVACCHNALTIEDLGSCNGTFVNERPVFHSELVPGDNLRLGAVTCVVSASPFDFQRVSETDSTFQIPKATTSATRVDGLTAAQEQIIAHILKGRSETDIAERLGKSPHTIHTHLKSIYRRFNVHSRAELIVRLVQQRRQEEGLP